MSLSKPYVPVVIDGVDRAFPANVRHLMPAEEEFGSALPKWVAFINEWFAWGLAENSEFVAVPGIDAEEAFFHINAIMHSFEPKHEHKTAACAILCEAWFTDICNYERTDDEKAIIRGETLRRTK